MNGETIAFYLLAALTTIGAVATVTHRNPLISALCLVATLFAVAGLFALLQAHFLAAIQVIVYAGAIMVLFVFVIMLLDRPDLEAVVALRSLFTKIVGVGAVFLLVVRLIPVLRGVGARAEVGEDYGTVRAMGRLLLHEYVFPFEAISVVLLVAIVGAVVLTKPRPS